MESGFKPRQIKKKCKKQNEATQINNKQQSNRRIRLTECLKYLISAAFKQYLNDGEGKFATDQTQTCNLSTPNLEFNPK